MTSKGEEVLGQVDHRQGHFRSDLLQETDLYTDATPRNGLGKVVL